MRTRDNRIRGIVARPCGVSRNRREVRNRDDHVDACGRDEEEASGPPENGESGCIVPGRHQRRKTWTPYTANKIGHHARSHGSLPRERSEGDRGRSRRCGGAVPRS